MKLGNWLFRAVSVVVIAAFMFSNAGFVLADNLRNPQPDKGQVAGKVIGDLRDQQAGQRTWLTGKPKPSQIIDAQAATQEYLIQAGRDKRIFSVAGPGAKDIKEQVAIRRSKNQRRTPATLS